MVVREVRAKSILNASKIYDFCVNPYTGCGVACRYCYAALFIPRYSGHSEPWGTFVDVKVNAPELLARQIPRAKPGQIWIASVCDPYQPAEERFGLTRACLEILRESGRRITIQTKSARILRDFDLIRSIPKVNVTISITTDDEKTASLFEPRASSPAERIEALARFHEAGVHTSAFIGPIIPGDHARLVGLLAGKVDDVLVDRLNYVPQVRAFAERHGFGHALTDAYFLERRRVIAAALKSAGIPARIVF
jgi:DNA repair photolyase